MFDRSYSDFANPAVVNAVLSIVVYALKYYHSCGGTIYAKTRYKTTVQELGLQRLIYWSDMAWHQCFYRLCHGIANSLGGGYFCIASFSARPSARRRI